MLHGCHPGATLSSAMPCRDTANHRLHRNCPSMADHHRQAQSPAPASLVRRSDERLRRDIAVAIVRAGPEAGRQAAPALRVDDGQLTDRGQGAALRCRPGHDQHWPGTGRDRRARPARRPAPWRRGRPTTAARPPARRQGRSRKAVCSRSLRPRRGSSRSLGEAAEPTAFPAGGQPHRSGRPDAGPQPDFAMPRQPTRESARPFSS
jgi:hypothetical protein